MNKYIEKAIREVAHTDNPEVFARHNQTAYQIANNVYEQLTKDAVDGVVVCNKMSYGFKDILMKIPECLNVHDKVKVIILKEG